MNNIFIEGDINTLNFLNKIEIRGCCIHKKYASSMNLISEWEAKQEFNLDWTDIIRRTNSGDFFQEYVYILNNEQKRIIEYY